MTEEEKQQFLSMQTDIRDIKADLARLCDNMEGFNKNMDEMYTALLGSKITKDGGIVGRLLELEKDAIDMRRQVDDLKRDIVKQSVRLAVVWTLAGALAASLLALALKAMFD